MPTEHADDEPVQDLLDRADPNHELAPCGLGQLIVGPNALQEVARTVDTLLPQRATRPSERNRRASVVMLVDPVPIRSQGADVKDTVEAQLSQLFDVRRVVLDDGRSELHVVDEIIEVASQAARTADALVAVGGGTISDIAKLASAQARSGSAPTLVSVQTAASVDGYTDDVSVVLRDGVKRTVPSRWPDAVIADSAVLAEAPPRMNRAGFGEMMSMLVAPADWRLASLVGTDETFCRPAIALLRDVGAGIGGWSGALREPQTTAVARLARVLGLRGVVTGVAGTTAVLSGTEHLISHMLDQRATLTGSPMGLHGAQVGVGSVVSAVAWEYLFERMSSSGELRLAPDALDRQGAEQRVRAAFADVDSTGRTGTECWRDYAAKLDALESRQDRLAALLSSWEEYESQLRALVTPSASVARALSNAGAAAAFEELEPTVPGDVSWWAVKNCSLMRNRFTVVDLLMLLGWWGDEDVAEVLDRAQRVALGTGLEAQA